MNPILAHLLSCLPQRPRAEVEALAAALEERGVTDPADLPRSIPEGRELGLTARQQVAIALALEAGPCVDLGWREALEAAGGAGLLRLVVLEAGIRSAWGLGEWSPDRISRVRWIGQGERLRQIRRAAARCGVAWGQDPGGEIPPAFPQPDPPPSPERGRRLTCEDVRASLGPRGAYASGAGRRLTWEGALRLWGGAALVRRAQAAGIDSSEALSRLSSGDVARLEGWGQVRLRQLRRAALSVGLDWAPDLERGPGQPSLSGAGESPRESVSLPPSLRAQVRERARSEGISASAWIRRAVEAALTAGGGDS